LPWEQHQHSGTSAHLIGQRWTARTTPVHPTAHPAGMHWVQGPAAVVQQVTLSRRAVSRCAQVVPGMLKRSTRRGRQGSREEQLVIPHHTTPTQNAPQSH
jgi:hypothetical protein